MDDRRESPLERKPFDEGRRRTGNLIWLDQAGEAFIAGALGQARELEIPPELEGLRVTTILYEAFAGMAQLERVTIPDSVTHIGNEAFRDCSALTRVSIPAGVRELGQGIFRGCSSLRQAQLPLCPPFGGDGMFSGCSALTEVAFSGDQPGRIPHAMFRSCTSLMQVRFPEGLKSIDSCAFEGCVRLRDVVLPESLRFIGVKAFHGCGSLEEIRIPDGTRLNPFGNPFSGCTGLKRILFYGDHPTLRLAGGALYDSGPGILLSCLPSLAGEEFSAAPGTTGLAWHCFEGCGSLRRVTLPPGVVLRDPASLAGLTDAAVLIPRSPENEAFLAEHGEALARQRLSPAFIG